MAQIEQIERPAVSVELGRGDGVDGPRRRGRPAGTRNKGPACGPAKVRRGKALDGRALQQARLALLGRKGYRSPLVVDGVAVAPKSLPAERRRGMEPVKPAPAVVTDEDKVHAGIGRPALGEVSFRHFNRSVKFVRRLARLQNL